MKKQALGCFASLVAAAALSQSTTPFVNTFNLQVPPLDPPQIDAPGFVNNSIFSIDLVSYMGSTIPYATRNTYSFTNNGTMSSTTGFRFQTFLPPSESLPNGAYTNAGIFFNGPGSVVNCGGTNLIGLFGTNFNLFRSWPGSQCIIGATNILNRGTIEMGVDSWLRLQGKDIVLTGGLINMEGLESGGGFNAGRFDGFWGYGESERWFPAGSLTSIGATTPLFTITNRDYGFARGAIAAVAPAYQLVTPLDPSNVLNQIVYVQNNVDPQIANNVYLFAGQSIVQWAWTWTNPITGDPVQDYLYLSDNSFPNPNNPVLRANGIAAPATGYRPSYMPSNLTLTRSGSALFGVPATPGLGINFGPGAVTNEYRAYRASFLPTTRIVGEGGHENFQNVPGRIEIAADQNLDLRGARIAGLNSLIVKATNNFAIDSRTRLLTYAANFDLGMSSGSMTLSNLLVPTCPRLNGDISIYSARWTNVIVGVTNMFHLLVVNSGVMSASPTVIENLTCHSTNLYVADVLNVLSNLTVDAVNLTVLTNGPDAMTPAGQINLLSGDLLWTNSFPRLENLTNFGRISTLNSAFFGTISYPPFYPNGQVQPYKSFVNHGTVTSQGCNIWADYFENTGLIDAGILGVSLQSTTALLSGGTFLAGGTFGDIAISASSLVVSNHTLAAGRALNLTVTNTLDDGGVTSSNFWTTGAGGFSLAAKPLLYSSLLGTTLSNTAPQWATVTCSWPGTDYGKSNTGYGNNAALGRLVLAGGLYSLFHFQGPGASNALYVDCIELWDYATNRYSNGDLVAFEAAAGMKVYFAQAYLVMTNGQKVSIAEKLDGRNGGSLNWVSTYPGAFSSTNVVYPDGTTNVLNTALVQSKIIDSDGDGTPNFWDPTPVTPAPTLGIVRLSSSMLPGPPASFVMSWPTLATATNRVYFKATLSDPIWLQLTNFVSGSTIGRWTNPITAPNRYFRVRVDLSSQ